MDYHEQLESPEWKKKRQEILNRDNNQCTVCKIERSKFLGLSKSFGIKTLEEMKDAGYSVSTELIENNLISFGNGFLNAVPFIEDPSLFALDKLRFALQHSNFKGEMICFTRSISESDMFPDLNIHHKYYILGHMAWEYENDALVTLCCDCHQLEHQNNQIVVYTKNREISHYALTCVRCDSSGYLPKYSYWQNGICFNCKGHGVTLIESK